MGAVTNYGGRIHDDFDNRYVQDNVSKYANKNIYAENFEENQLLVRIKLAEYLEVDGKIITGEKKDDTKNLSPIFQDCYIELESM